MANTKQFRKIGPFSNVVEKIELEYDFDNDAGVVGALDLGEAGDPIVVHETHTKVKTAFTSGGAATLIIGVTGDTNAILQSTAVASLTVGELLKGDAASNQIKMASGDKIIMTIGAFDMTAGKMKVVMLISKF